ncbi:MAG: hypothetical protein MUE54_13505 [Anaerolineae bacterium]|jgi:hypothetical protein|nr:hypothetical protein [Anaerolineae bacterium]
MNFERDYSSMSLLARIFFVVGAIWIVVGVILVLQRYTMLQDMVNTNSMADINSILSGRDSIFALIGDLIGTVAYGIGLFALGFGLEALREIVLNSRWQSEFSEQQKEEAVKQTALLEQLVEKQ